MIDDTVTAEQWNIPEGAEVRSADDEGLGKVVAVAPGYIVAEKGFFFPTEYYIPRSAITSYDGERVYLSVTKDEALNTGWDTRPVEVEDERYVADAGTAATYDTATTGRRDDAAFAETAAAERMETGTDTIRVPVHEEELTATTRARDLGAVEIGKDVVTEERVLEVPVTEERVRVTRRAVDREVGPDATAFEEGTIEVPIRGEEVELQKRTRVAEEVELTKEQVQRTEQVGGTVRKERVRVEDRSDADVIGGETGAASSWDDVESSDKPR
jgi:uncharacterized protein (TIGR02271 family)